MAVDHEQRMWAKVHESAADYDQARCAAVAMALPRTTRDWMAVQFFDDMVRCEIRAKTREAERGAGRRNVAVTPVAATGVTGAGGEEAGPFAGLKHGSTDRRKGAAVRGCECERCVEVLRFDRESEARLVKKATTWVRAYSAEMKMQWTAELLGSSFALADGSLVTWGQASIEQHKARAAMFTKQAAAGIEGAARHQAAISDLSRAGASCLAELVGGQAAA